MINSQSCVINRCCGSHKDSIAAYRLLRNDSWSEDDVVRAMSQACASNVSCLSHILLIGDTSELNFDNMSGRLSKDDPDFGPVQTRAWNSACSSIPRLPLTPRATPPSGLHMSTYGAASATGRTSRTGTCALSSRRSRSSGRAGLRRRTRRSPKA